MWAPHIYVRVYAFMWAFCIKLKLLCSVQAIGRPIRLFISAMDGSNFNPNNERLRSIGAQIKFKPSKSKWTVESAALQPLRYRPEDFPFPPTPTLTLLVLYILLVVWNRIHVPIVPIPMVPWQILIAPRGSRWLLEAYLPPVLRPFRAALPFPNSRRQWWARAGR